MKKRNNISKGLTSSKTGVYLLGSVAVGIFTVVALLWALAQLLCKIDIPLNTLSPITTVLLCIGSFVSATVFSTLLGKRGMLGGAMIGLVLFVLLIGVGLIFGNMSLGGSAFIKLAAMLCAGALGGLWGVVLAEHKHRIH